MNYQIEPAVDYGDGEVHDHIVKDAITQADWELAQFGAQRAMRNIAPLRAMVGNKTYRSAEAADLILRIQRLALEEMDEVPVRDSETIDN